MGLSSKSTKRPGKQQPLKRDTRLRILPFGVVSKKIQTPDENWHLEEL